MRWGGPAKRVKKNRGLIVFGVEGATMPPHSRRIELIQADDKYMNPLYFNHAIGPHARIVPDSNARHESHEIQVRVPFWDVGPTGESHRFQLHGLTNFETASGPHARIVPDSNARHQSPPIAMHAPSWDVAFLGADLAVSLSMLLALKALAAPGHPHSAVEGLIEIGANLHRGTDHHHSECRSLSVPTQMSEARWSSPKACRP